MGHFGAIIAASALISTEAAAHQPAADHSLPAQPFSAGVLLTADISAMPNAGAGPAPIVLAADIGPLFTNPVVIPLGSRCRTPPLDGSWEGGVTYNAWCKSLNTSFPAYEAEKDVAKSINNAGPLYQYSVFYDCQLTGDKAAMPKKVRDAVCVHVLDTD